MAQVIRRTLQGRSEVLARELSRWYIYCRTRWQKTRGHNAAVNPLTRTSHAGWTKAAVFLLTNEIRHYPEYIGAQFAHWPNIKFYPQPHQCFGKSGLVRWWGVARRDELMEERLAHRLQEQVAVLQRASTQEMLFDGKVPVSEGSALDNADAVRLSLLDAGLSLTPLFRFVIASHGKWGDLMETFQEEAFKQYRIHRRSYDATWVAFGSLLDPFRERVAQEVF